MKKLILGLMVATAIVQPATAFYAGSGRSAPTNIETYQCWVAQTFPYTAKLDHDPIMTTKIELSTANGQKYINVYHQLKNKIVSRYDQYSKNWKLSVKLGQDQSTWMWTGTYLKDRSVSMIGIFNGSEGEGSYSEQINENGEMKTVGVWTCQTVQ